MNTRIAAPAGIAGGSHSGGKMIVAGVGYVAAWLVGLFAAPPAPGIGTSAGEIHAHYVANAAAVAVQSLLVHGLAGLALAVIVVGLRRTFSDGLRWPRATLTAGMAAVAISFLQSAFALFAVARAASGTADQSLRLFTAINVADSAKLLMLGIFIASISLEGARRRLPTWLARFGSGLALLLPLSGAAFIVNSQALFSLLYLTLPLLLVWVLAVCVVTARSSAVAAPR